MQATQNLGNYLGSLREKRQDTEFMPEVEGAILEDSPWLTRLTVWSVCACLLAALVWAHFAVLEEVTTGQGKAIPSSKVQVIQNLEGGIVSEIFVREGQVVNKGDTLLRLDDTRFLSNQGETEADRLALIARIERLTAEAEGRAPALPEEVSRDAPQLAEDELALYRSRQQRLESEQRTLGEQYRQKEQELAEFRSKAQQYRSSLGLLQQELNMSQPLVASGAISQVELLRLRRSLVEQRGALEATNLAIPRAEAAMAEIKSKMQESQLAFRAEAFKELNEVRTELQKINATSVAIQDKVTRTTVTSPVRGVIKQLKVNTIGGVVQPGSDMLEIVPLDDSLLIEAKVRPQDVAFLHPGQKAMVKFTAYDYTIYGGLKANLELISADTITDEEGNSFYLIQVRTEKSHLGSDENPLLIIPGMVASVDIITGEKSVLAYLLKPVLKARSEAMRER
ncbi:Type I secretion system membrane fusion protein PrsE [Pseudomonas sp. THAF187a]|uniref:Membrane fusion protein (MFP) family protein n=1 Tax=Ectopseudomonas khazarica TaxID=2502979 RepID=A0ABW7M8R8_9GAMM|nr:MULTISPECIES: HlyD family type I secretion periplasmic adaptor subunit [unclassified Pseudomonas]QFT21778.1 Type I secretion system membrane fusion protein PrsE [Pseudomonas sp. THAF187a]QFT41965.1 Type I secretion system membrane fusion protein PrsE [Pseudomonas sp. THAF42]TNF08959.1 MAG: HlyD family type I secretion periplasmic adaptor subunit [Pseudomonadales bacterium]WFC62141.1 HlyD family type I secretion periplasmic adaptor subunit [Pseudomonas sp. REST10]|tara:strand:+ start:223 stop:1581 length:1359 start_codon:yes stop_codon:yes gene_type:complete